MKPWWERWPRRLEWELKAFKDAGLIFELDEKEFARGRVILRGSAPVSAQENHEFVIVYPDIFPETRFAIFAPTLKLTRHQSPFEGNLCIFPRDSHYWQPQITAAEVMKIWVPNLVALVRKGGAELEKAEDPQGEPFATYFPYYGNGSVIVPTEALSIPKEILRGTYLMRFRGPADWIEIAGSSVPPIAIGSALILEVHNENGRLLAKAQPELAAAFMGIEYKGNWARMTVPDDAPSARGFLDNLIRKLPRNITTKGKLQRPSGRYDIPAAVFAEEVRRNQQGDSWAFFLLGQNSSGRQAWTVMLRGIPFGQDLLGERVPELKPLRTKKIVIIGLGTLGAPLAVHMCKAQVGTLILADPDYADPNTGVRWTTELDGAGANKSMALERRLSIDYPFTKIESVPFRMGDTALTREAGSGEIAILDRVLVGADIIIDATAEENVSSALASIAHELDLPLVTVFSIDGLGGVVARIRNHETGCFHCLGLARERGDIAWPVGAADQDSTRVQTRGCADPTFIGTSVDLEPLVTQAASIVFGTLCRGSEGGYPELEAKDVFILQLRNPDRSLKLPEWKAFRLPKDPQCPLCSARQQSSAAPPQT